MTELIDSIADYIEDEFVWNEMMVDVYKEEYDRYEIDVPDCIEYF